MMRFEVMHAFGLSMAEADALDPDVIEGMERFVITRRLERQEELRLLVTAAAAKV